MEAQRTQKGNRGQADMFLHLDWSLLKFPAFFRGLVSSPSKEVSVMNNLVGQNLRSVTGQNLRFCTVPTSLMNSSTTWRWLRLQARTVEDRIFCSIGRLPNISHQIKNSRADKPYWYSVYKLTLKGPCHESLYSTDTFFSSKCRKGGIVQTLYETPSWARCFFCGGWAVYKENG